MEQPLYHPIKVEVTLTCPEELTKLLLFCHDNRLQAVPQAAAQFTPLLFDRTPRKPIPALVELCGPEWLNPKKMLSPYDTYQFLKDYILKHNLRDSAGVIRFSPTLLSVFPNAPPQPLFDHQLYSLVPQLLQPESPA
jgi:hypothetical protein